jgi:hypothetical protein
VLAIELGELDIAMMLIDKKAAVNATDQVAQWHSNEIRVSISVLAAGCQFCVVVTRRMATPR